MRMFGNFRKRAKKKKTAISLSGGGALGFAHIGVLKSLENHGIFPEVISGSSMGAIVGVLYASGISPDEMLQYIKEDKLYKITKIMSFRPWNLTSGLSGHQTLRELIKELIPHNSFEKLGKEMHICVSNMTLGEYEIVSSGDELDFWVAASASIPGVFEAMKHHDNIYVDGGLLNNLPAQALEKKAEYLIAVDVLPYFLQEKLKNPRDILMSSVRVMQKQNSKAGKEIADFVIEPTAVRKYHEFSFEQYEEIYRSGLETTDLYIQSNPTIQRLSLNK
jgi:NTE family protein